MSSQQPLEQENPGIYLMIEFEWPESFASEIAQTAAKLHQLTIDPEVTWIDEVVAASGGIGGDLSSSWIFWLENYAALDKLLKDKSNEISSTYHAFFSAMKTVRDQIREKVVFL